MLPIHNGLLYCVLYIYKTETDAKEGGITGGTGFLVSVPLTNNPEKNAFYAVTARHVLEGMPNPILRLNTASGATDTLNTNRQRWIGWEDTFGDDLAVCPIEIDEEIFDFSAIPVSMFLVEEVKNRFFPGDETFMIGRFISHEGTKQNKPSVRFGNISMMPEETLKNKYDHQQETFLVEQRSLPGYSGSPVFVIIDQTSPRPPMWMTPVNHQYNPARHGPFLLGVDWVHIHNYEKLLKEKDGDKPVKPEQFVKAHSGMAGVVPAWRLQKLLDVPVLVEARRKMDERETTQKMNTT
jgi:hypothetical protein